MDSPASAVEPTDQPPVRLIDWDLARSGARALAPAGPKISAQDAADVVASLREAARQAHGPVAQTSRLHSPPSSQPALVVDRAAWVSANVHSFQAMLDPIVAGMLVKPGRPAPHPLVAAVSGKITGAELAALLAFLSTKVLGQYDLAPGRPADSARLLLVAPNIVAAERELAVDPRDFRLWVCLHEETHRVQFTAVPWLRDHMLATSDEVARALAPDPDQLRERLKSLAANLRDSLEPGGLGLAQLFLTPEQQERLASVTAVMALLEGHAEVVMDEVGPQVVPSVTQIRATFDQRREALGVFDLVIRRLLGLEAKMAQYRDGAAFVRAVTQRVGVDGFNAVWTSPESLPTAAEIADPARWVARVHG